MAKKKKKKLNKKLKAQAIQSASTAPIEKVEVQKTSPKPIESKINPELEEEKIQSKKETKKILLTMAIIAIFIVGIYFINIKTDLVLKAGDFLTELLNINI